MFCGIPRRFGAREVRSVVAGALRNALQFNSKISDVAHTPNRKPEDASAASGAPNVSMRIQSRSASRAFAASVAGMQGIREFVAGARISVESSAFFDGANSR
jgi:hypothetical protein